MKTQAIPTSTNHTNSQKTRPTIGMLIDNPKHLPGQMWLGAVETARQHDVNLLCFAGEALGDPDEFGAQANIIYDLVNINRLDGLIIAAATIGTFLTQQEMETFCQRYVPLPIVTMEASVPGYPCVFADDYQAMRHVVAHLITVHEYRRIAFVCGPEGHAGVQRRYRAYLDILAEHGLPHDPDLITPPVRNWWGMEIPAEMLDLLLNERKTQVEAIVTACDEIGLGIVRVLQERGIRVPQDIAVVGYDDLPKSGAITPPLTTVRPAFFELGQKALELALHMIAGEPVPEQMPIPAKFIVRQSCGCESPAVKQAAAKAIVKQDEPFETAMMNRSDEIIAEMARVVGATEESLLWGELVFEAFIAEIQGNSPGRFLTTLNDVLRQITANEHHRQYRSIGSLEASVTAWQNALSVLRNHILSFLRNERAVDRAENLWQQARVLIGEIAIQVKTYQALQVIEQAQMVQEIGARLIASFNIGELMDVLAEGFPKLGIPGCYLALYEDSSGERGDSKREKPTETSRLLLAYHEAKTNFSNGVLHPGRRIDIGTEGILFPSCELVPMELLQRDEAVNVLIEPLYFREEQIGFVIFEVGSQRIDIYETLQAEISGALQRALLVQRVQERTTEITRTNAELAQKQYILDMFMENVPDTIYFKDRNSRIIRANKAHAKLFGLHDPSEEIGKTDFDFFPEKAARMKYEQEQEIIRSGKPSGTYEEPDGKGRWVLTTKMPLRNEHGEIIGTFGISRDITALKQAQAALERAYAEIEQRVERRTAELQQEIAERKRAEKEIRQLQLFLYNIIDSMPSILIVINTEGLVTQWNWEAERVTGISPRKAYNRRLTEVFPRLAEVTSNVQQTIGNHVPQKVTKILWKSHDETRYVDITIYPLMKDSVEGAVIRIDDVTERVRLENMMIQTEKMMTVGGLAAGMAHEINNPLGIILQGIQNMLRRLSPELPANQAVAAKIGLDLDHLQTYLNRRNISQYLEGIREAGTRAAKIVTDMLNFSHPHESNIVPIDINQLLDATIDLASNDYDLKKHYDFRDINILREYERSLTTVPCIPNELEQVILNLLRNAAQALAERHSPEHSACIRIMTCKKQNHACITIEDNGLGMTEEVRKRIFEPFYTTKEVGTGTGLGLSISYFIIVNHHQGEISVDSIPDQGTTFTILLPLHKE